MIFATHRQLKTMATIVKNNPDSDDRYLLTHVSDVIKAGGNDSLRLTYEDHTFEILPNGSYEKVSNYA
jgi:hypothetical protein